MTMRWRNSIAAEDQTTSSTTPEDDQQSQQTSSSRSGSLNNSKGPQTSSTSELGSSSSQEEGHTTSSSISNHNDGELKSSKQKTQPLARGKGGGAHTTTSSGPSGDPPYQSSSSTSSTTPVTSSSSSGSTNSSSGSMSAAHQQAQQQHQDDDEGDYDGGGGGTNSGPAQQSSSSNATSSRIADGGGASTSTGDGGTSSSSSSGGSNAQIVDDSGGNDQQQQQPDVVVPPWKPQATQSTCEFIHTIANYSSKRDSGCKKAEYSATTVDDCGNRWRLIVYVNGNGRASNHHLSLFLQVADADDLPFGWKKAVSYVLTLEHPSGSSSSYAKRNPDKTFKLCPKAIDWGWSQFITSDRIQQEGFVHDDALIVRASVTVKSSSVCIDMEDAELYLKCAVEEGKPEAVQLCLDQGASVNCQFKDDLYTPLHTACSSSTGEDDSNGTGTANSPASSDTSPNSAQPMIGINDGSMKVLNLLLEKGADGNACNKWKETPLLIAANNGHRAAVEALLKHGADPSLCSEAGWSALTFAAHKGYADIVALLLRAGAPVNCRVTEDSSTPLHKACAGSKAGHQQAVELLLDKGADVHALNKWRETPLLTAANHGQGGAVDALLGAGADPCKCTDTGWSPLSIAAYKGHDDVVKLLLDEGAPTEEADPTLSALLQAATKGLPDTVELLLKHGADHTVTTKKGDTALSILVEQNLIDMAVEMVTEYKASVPRCSRDRKKVTKARLLINHKVKQQEREGKKILFDDEDDDDGESDGFTKDTMALHDDDGENVAKKQPTSKSSKKKKKKKNSAEAEAKAAEEALLMELEQEDADREKQEQDANKKSAKKKKKKERERQQKKEVEERRLAVERDKEDKLREEREAREAKVRDERDRLAAIKRKEDDAERKRIQTEMEKKKRELQKREAEQKKKDQVKKKQQQEKAKVERDRAAAERTEKNKNAMLSGGSTPNNVESAPRSSGSNRGWEVKAGNDSSKTPSKSVGAGRGHVISQHTQQDSSYGRQSSAGSPFAGTRREIGNHASPQLPGAPGAPTYSKSEPILPAVSSSRMTQKAGIEIPAVELFRREKLSELLQRCLVARSSSDALGAVSEATVKKSIYKWIVRAAHDTSDHIDCMVPSWRDFERLTNFFQRQFISESRKGMNPSARGSTMTSMESLKKAGSDMAILCHSLAKEVAEFATRVEDQLSSDWSDSSIGMKAEDMTRNGGGAVIMLDWARRSPVYVAAKTFSELQERYVGAADRLLTSIYSMKIRYESKQTLVSGTSLDCRLLSDTQSVLSAQASVSAEVWSEPTNVRKGNFFWGQFKDVDGPFGGLSPFSSEEDRDKLLASRGAAVSMIVPMDNMVASRYVHHAQDILESAEKSGAPVSFAMFLRAECFLDANASPSLNEFQLLDPRLRDQNRKFLSLVEPLGAGQHSFCNGQTGIAEVSTTGSLFVLLQNETARARFNFGDQVLTAMLVSLASTGSTPLPKQVAMTQETSRFSLPSSFADPKFIAATSQGSQDPTHLVSGYFDSQGSSSPHSSRVPSDPFGAIGGDAIGSAFSSRNPTILGTNSSGSNASRRPATRGRLFDLVDHGEDDVEEDPTTLLPAIDVVSGMLGNLNMEDLFQQPSSHDNIDIEAISLMGIGGPTAATASHPQASRLQPRPRHPF